VSFKLVSAVDHGIGRGGLTNRSGVGRTVVDLPC
jgi:hypothetical protein